eukprot:jgi/Orpsp1_1/1176602/evm.model.c7180000058277.1
MKYIKLFKLINLLKYYSRELYDIVEITINPLTTEKNILLEKLHINNAKLNGKFSQFLNLPYLKTLLLTNCGIKKFPNEINYNSLIELISLSENEIEEFPYFLLNLPNIIKLELSNAKIKDIPMNINKESKITS